jgi:hypothetical protein
MVKNTRALPQPCNLSSWHSVYQHTEKTAPLTFICEICFCLIVPCIDLMNHICADIILLVSILLSMVHCHNIFCLTCVLSIRISVRLKNWCQVKDLSYCSRTVFIFIWFESIPYMNREETKPNYKVRNSNNSLQVSQCITSEIFDNGILYLKLLGYWHLSTHHLVEHNELDLFSLCGERVRKALPEFWS